MRIFYKISIDHVNVNYLSGWCFHLLRKAEPLVLQCFQGDRLLLEAEANRHREDLLELGVHPTGNCGFEFSLGQISELNRAVPIYIKAKSSGTKLVELSFTDEEPKYHKAVQLPFRNIFRKKGAPQKPVVFMHIPKTAGTTFNTLAQSFYPKGSAITHIELLPNSRFRSLIDQHHYISGHLRFGLLKNYFPPEKVEFYAIVREPYAQLHSHLKWLVQTASRKDDTFFKSTNEVIYDLGRTLSQVNFSSIASLSHFVEKLSDLEAAFLDNTQTRYFLEKQPSRVKAEDIAEAISNVKLFRLIGFTEEYPEFVTEFVKLNCLQGAARAGQMNISKSSDLLDLNNEMVRDILKPLVVIDVQLYQLLKEQGG